MAEHSTKAEYLMNFKDATILANMTSYKDHLLEEAMEIQVNPDNSKRYWITYGPFMVPGHKYHEIYERTKETS
jgi:hypothetical protein